MRELKFRVFSEHKGTYDGDFVIMGDSAFSTEITHYGIVVGTEIKGFIEQSTGLQDSKGNDIYEGDILCDNISGDMFIVIWSEMFAAFVLVEIEGSGLSMQRSMMAQIVNNLTIAGNKRENAELLNN